MIRPIAFAVCLGAVLTVAAACTSTSETPEAKTCTDGSVQLIQAANYDQSCTADIDCVAIGEGNACFPCLIDCPNAAINLAARIQYQSDVSKTNAGGHAGDFCGCPASFAPCCRAGKCHADMQCSSAPAPSCALGAACSDPQVCMGGIAGCTSNCQCLGGTWHPPCPQALPPTGSACNAVGAECGYVTSTNACGAANCSCQGGTWTCGPTCVVTPSDAGPDAAADGGVDACAAPVVCTGACVSGAHNVSHMVDGCLVVQCCVPDDAGAE